MPYIALRPCRFNRPYSIGETIPDEVVDPARAEGLIAMGRIQRIFAQKSGESGAELYVAENAPMETTGHSQDPEESAGQAQESADSAPEGGDAVKDEKDAEKPTKAKTDRKKTAAKK